MTRTQIIFELRKYVKPEYYHRILNYPTPNLKVMLIAYQQEAYPVLHDIGGSRGEGLKRVMTFKSA